MKELQNIIKSLQELDKELTRKELDKNNYQAVQLVNYSQKCEKLNEVTHELAKLYDYIFTDDEVTKEDILDTKNCDILLNRLISVKAKLFSIIEKLL